VKILSIITTILFFSFSLSAQNEIPSVVKAALDEMFDGAKSVKWELNEDNEYESVFKLKRKRMTAKFDPEGNWLETEYEIKNHELPAAVAMAIKLEFAEHEIDGVEKIITPERKESYEVGLIDEKDLTWKVVFTASGKVLEKDLEEEG